MSTPLPPFVPLPEFVQDQFDRGLDPLDDAEVRAWLEQHPEHLLAFASLRATLCTPADLPLARSRPRWRLPLALAAGAAVLLVGGLWSWFAPPAPRSTALPRPLLAPSGCVLAVATRECVVDDTREFARAVVQGTLSRRATTTFSTAAIDRAGAPSDPRTMVRTTIHAETISP